jgi:hypothetical protein
MINLSTTHEWHLVTIDDPAFLRGKSIFDMLKFLSQHGKFKYVILNDIVGTSQNGLMAILQEKENSVLKLNDFLNVVCDVRQFEWGDFFLFKEYPQDWVDATTGDYYPPIIEKTDTTVRAIDNQYIYIYTPHQSIADVVLDKYEIESIKTSPLNALDFPY